MYRLLGVDHFIFHINSASPEVMHLLHMYERKGIVTVEQWPLYLESNGQPPDLKYLGQSTAYTHCHYTFLKRVSR